MKARPLNGLTVRKNIAFCLVLLAVLSLAWGQRVVYAQPPPQLPPEEYEGLKSMLNSIKSIKYRYSNSRGASGEVGFRVIGEETVGGEAAWKVSWEYTVDGALRTLLLWISKSTGECLRVEVEGETYTGEQARVFGIAVLLVWVNWVGVWTRAWEFRQLYGYVELGYGRLVYYGSVRKAFGPSQLTVYKWRWEGYERAPAGYRSIVELELAPVSFGTLLARFYGESLDRKEWDKLELLSIELVSPQPLPSIVVRLSLDKTRLKPNEEATATITASNTGSAAGAHNITITVGGEVKKSWLVVLNPGESKSLSYTLSFPAEGTYIVGADGETATVTVSAVLPARFEISGLSVPGSGRVGQPLTISVIVKNTGGEAGTHKVTLKVNGEVVEAKTVTLSPGQSTSLTFSYTPAREGTYIIEVDGLSGSVTVLSVVKEEGPAPAAPGVPWLIIAAAVAVAVILAIMLLRRKRKAEVPPPPPPPS